MPHIEIYPGQIFLVILFALLFLLVIKHNMTLQELIAALNSTGAQPIAILILILGILSLKMFPGSQTAAAIVGSALTLLSNQFGKKDDK